MITVISIIFLNLVAVEPVSLPEYKLAQETAVKLVEETKSVLMKKIAEAGPAGAIQECSRVALEIARSKEKSGWRVRRVSEKFRNIEDRPDEYEREVLNKFSELKKENKLVSGFVHAEVVEEGDRRYLRFMKPIIVQEFCLKCHGNAREIPEDVKKKLRELYPDDKATGYVSGDLRGAVSIKIPLND